MGGTFQVGIKTTGVENAPCDVKLCLTKLESSLTQDSVTAKMLIPSPHVGDSGNSQS